MKSAIELAEEDLQRSGITLEQAEAAGMYVTEDAKEISDDFKAGPALVIPYLSANRSPLQYSTGNEKRDFARVRYLGPAPKQNGLIKKKKTQRYAQPKESDIFAYFPHVEGIDWEEIIDDPKTPIAITEGEKKALVSCACGIPTIGLGGVFNFMRGDNLLPELAAINFSGRAVYIAFDSDAADNPNIQAAEGRLATELSLKKGADVFLARIPKVPGQDKTGIDDLYVAKGADAVFKAFEASPQMRKIDAAVLGLNKSVAWVDRDGMILDLENNEFIRKHDFTNGSKYSALEVISPSMATGKPTRVSVAAEFLTHPLARRYEDVIFRPDVPLETIQTSHGEAYNIWRGWDSVDGDVDPFLDLSEHLFADLPEEHQELALRLIAYKAQNPGEKVPLALVLIGKQGCGKSLWARLIREAFAPTDRDWETCK